MVTSILAVSSLMLSMVMCLNYHAIVHGGVNLKDLCEECDTSTGSGYSQHPKYCHLFVHCSLGGDGQLSGLVKECTRGLLWSQSVKQCVWPQQSDCPSNPCVDQSLSFRDVRSCNGYFSCPNGERLDYSCCPSDQRYDEGQGLCVHDPACSDPCLPGSAKVTAKTPECERFSIAENSRQYLWAVGGRNVTMTCATGTAFSADFCSCTDIPALPSSPTPEKCEPYIWFPFDTGIKDKQAHSASGGIADVISSPKGSLGGGAAYFGGHHQVVAWAMNNMEFHSNFTLSFRFKADVSDRKTGSGPHRYALVDNSDCNKEATFGAALLISAHKRATVHGGFRLKNGQAFTASSGQLDIRHKHFTPDSMKTLFGDVPPDTRFKFLMKERLDRWHEVVLMKHGPRAQLIVDGNRHPIEGQGLEADIDRVDCAMTIGKGTGLQDFVGYIDEVKYYKCVPDQYL